MMKIMKRNGDLVDFNSNKIYNAIMDSMIKGSSIINKSVAEQITDEITEYFKHSTDVCTVYNVEQMVIDKLYEKSEPLTARAYEKYKTIQSFKRESNTTDESIISLVRGTNEAVMSENSNKNARTASTQRDLIAGEISKDISRRKLIPTHIVQAHDEGIIHWHDLDYTVQQIPNCCLVNLKDMLDNGTVINGKLVESPKSFKTASTVATQIMAQVASGQYGGQTTSLSHLAPYVRKSYHKYIEEVKRESELTGIDYTEQQIKDIAWSRTRTEVKDGVQTIQYQIQTLATSNGQSPFVSLFMYLNEDEEYIEEMALIVEEVLKQRIQGVKNEQGVWISPAFPKLLYVLDENNVPKDSKYRYLTDLAIKCVAKRLVPDFISAKKMKEHYDGEVFPCINKLCL